MLQYIRCLNLVEYLEWCTSCSQLRMYSQTNSTFINIAGSVYNLYMWSWLWIFYRKSYEHMSHIFFVSSDMRNIEFNINFIMLTIEFRKFPIVLFSPSQSVLSTQIQDIWLTTGYFVSILGLPLHYPAHSIWLELALQIAIFGCGRR